MNDPIARPEAPADERFEALYRRYYWSLVGFCRASLPDRSAAEDVAQEAFLRAYRYGHALDPTRSPWPWLKTIAKNVMATRAQRVSREVPSEPPDVACGEHAGGTEQALVISEALRGISPRHRDALRLRYVDGLSPHGAAERLRLSISAFNQLVFRARSKLRAELERLGETVPALAPVAWLRGWLRRAGARASRTGAPSRAGVDILVQAIGGVALLVAGLSLQKTDVHEPLATTPVVAVASSDADAPPRELRRALTQEPIAPRGLATGDESGKTSKKRPAEIQEIIGAIAEDPDRKARTRAHFAPGRLGLPLAPPAIPDPCGAVSCDALGLDLDQVPGAKKIVR